MHLLLKIEPVITIATNKALFSLMIASRVWRRSLVNCAYIIKLHWRCNLPHFYSWSFSQVALLKRESWGSQRTRNIYYMLRHQILQIGFHELEDLMKPTALGYFSILILVGVQDKCLRSNSFSFRKTYLCNYAFII